MEQWRIQRDRTKCPEPGCPLPSAQDYFAVLDVTALLRKDLCATCFHREQQVERERPLVYWKCSRKPGQKQGPRLDLVALRVLFDRLGEIGDDKARGLRYFVSLLLIRKRILKIVDPQNAEQEQADLVVLDPKVEGMKPVALTAPELDEERLANLENELMEALADDDPVDAGEDAGIEAGAGTPAP